MSKEQTHIIKDIASTIGGGELSKMYIITSLSSGKTEVVIEKTISKRMPVTEYSEAEEIYEKLNGGRKVVTIEDILKFQKN